MNAFLPIIVIAGFGLVLYCGTIIWTEKLFPKKDVKQAQFDFEQSNREPKKTDTPQELVHSR